MSSIYMQFTNVDSISILYWGGMTCISMICMTCTLLVLWRVYISCMTCTLLVVWRAHISCMTCTLLVVWRAHISCMTCTLLVVWRVHISCITCTFSCKPVAQFSLNNVHKRGLKHHHFSCKRGSFAHVYKCCSLPQICLNIWHFRTNPSVPAWCMYWCSNIHNTRIENEGICRFLHTHWLRTLYIYIEHNPNGVIRKMKLMLFYASFVHTIEAKLGQARTGDTWSEIIDEIFSWAGSNQRLSDQKSSTLPLDYWARRKNCGNPEHQNPW